MNDKHLMWWVFKAIEAEDHRKSLRGVLLSPETWERLGAPDWVLPAIKEKYAEKT